MKKELYPWQEDCLNKWFANHGRGMVQAVTGSGKTLLAMTAAKRLENKLTPDLRVKIVVPTGALMRQWARALKEFLQDSRQDAALSGAARLPDTPRPDIPASAALSGATRLPGTPRREIGLRGAGCQSSADCRYMIYVINSARYELARQILSDLKNGFAVLLIADECHRYESEQNRLIFEFLPYIKQYEERFFSLGLSATLPSGQAQNFLASVLGPRIYSYGIRQAITMHTVCSYDIFHVGLSFLPDEKAEYQELTDRMSYLYTSLLRIYPSLGDLSVKELFDELSILSHDKNRKIAEAASMYIRLSYHRKNLVCLASSRISCTCELVRRLPQAGKILIFGERIRQADELCELLREQYPERVGRYHSQMGQTANRNALERFRDGSIRILIACRAVDEGLDVPDADIGIILSGTSVQRQRIQRLGRVIRTAEGKERASLYYLHLEGTTEDLCFLPDTGGNRIFDLEYLADTKSFLTPSYDEAAEALLSEMRLAGACPAVLDEAARCLDLGCVRSDWLLGRSELNLRIENAKNTAARNYWLCMKKISALIGRRPRRFS